MNVKMTIIESYYIIYTTENSIFIYVKKHAIFCRKTTYFSVEKQPIFFAQKQPIFFAQKQPIFFAQKKPIFLQKNEFADYHIYI
jgi:hypothetical protein